MDGPKPHPMQEIREYVGWTRARFARSLGITPSYLGQVESGAIQALGPKILRGLRATHKLGDIVALEEAIREWNADGTRRLAREYKEARRQRQNLGEDPSTFTDTEG